ncbi:MAG: hypothetical protein ACRDGV_10930 [Candidatus Limnocylindria bacterium]
MTMPRRSGKAANRRSRQRAARAQRATTPTRAPQPAPQARPASEAAAIPPVGTPDAREAATLEPPRRPDAATVSGRSGLGAQARSEYHYVERDLRNIGILSAVMALLLLAAWVAFTFLSAGGA